MHGITAENLRSAYGGESMAHMRYMIWADKAEREGFPNVARLFRAVSFAERAHATGHFNVMKDVAGGFSVVAGAGFGIGPTSQNLQGAIEGENFEIAEMYPAYLAVADMQGEKSAHRSMTWAMAAETIHAEMYAQAKKAVDGGADAGFGPIHVCEVCGHTLEGDAPDKCPVCGALKKRFRAFG